MLQLGKQIHFTKFYWANHFFHSGKNQKKTAVHSFRKKFKGIDNNQYVIAITRWRFQYRKCPANFLCFANCLTSFQASKIVPHYEKQKEYFPILHEAIWNNYFIVKCLLKLNMARGFLLTFLLNGSSLLNTL